jgi:hypothetical protein
MSVDRERSRDPDGRLVRHQHSNASFDLNRHVPMYVSESYNHPRVLSHLSYNLETMC